MMEIYWRTASRRIPSCQVMPYRIAPRAPVNGWWTFLFMIHSIATVSLPPAEHIHHPSESSGLFQTNQRSRQRPCVRLYFLVPWSICRPFIAPHDFFPVSGLYIIMRVSSDSFDVWSQRESYSSFRRYCTLSRMYLDQNKIWCVRYPGMSINNVLFITHAKKSTGHHM